MVKNSSSRLVFRGHGNFIFHALQVINKINFIWLFLTLITLTTFSVKAYSPLRCDSIFTESVALSENIASVAWLDLRSASYPTDYESQHYGSFTSEYDGYESSRYGPTDWFFHAPPETKILYQRVLSLLAPSNSNRPLLSIVIPAYREATRLPRSLEILTHFMNQFPLAYEVLVVVEASPDATLQVAQAAAAQDPRIRVIQNVNGLGQPFRGGKGWAVRSGMRQAQGDYRLFMDADFSTRLAEMFAFLAVALDESIDGRPHILVGSRDNSQGPRSLLRTATSLGMKLITHGMGLGCGVEDTQCGFKMFDANSANILFSMARENKFAFDVELLQLANAMQFRVGSMPVQWIDSPGSTVRPFVDGVQMAWAMARMRVRAGLQAGRFRVEPGSAPAAAE